MTYEGKKFEHIDEVVEYIYDQAKDEAVIVAEENGVENLDMEEYVSNYPDKKIDEFHSLRSQELELKTDHCYIKGRMVGAVEYVYPVYANMDGGYDYEAIVEYAFRKRNGKVVRAFEGKDGLWKLRPVTKEHTIIWGEYPDDCPAEWVAPGWWGPKKFLKSDVDLDEPLPF